MLIIMLQTRRGSEDGFAVHRFYKGCRYELTDTLARYFIRTGWATTVIPNVCEGS